MNCIWWNGWREGYALPSSLAMAKWPMSRASIADGEFAFHTSYLKLSESTWLRIIFFQLSNRITIDHNPKENATKLNIKSVQVHDEEVYKCTTTYLDPRETCDSFDSYSIQLNVLGNFCPNSITNATCFETITISFDGWHSFCAL